MYPVTEAARPDYGRVLERISELRSAGATEAAERRRIQAIMDGGVAGIQAVMAWDQGRQGNQTDIARKYGYDLAAVNLMASGVERLSQRVGDMPYLRAAEAHSRELREQFSKRRAIVFDWDQYQQIESLYPQIARWLPGYTHVLLVIKQSYYSYVADDEVPYPMVELRDSFDVYPGYGLEPDDVVVFRTVPLRTLKHQYPDVDWAAAEIDLKQKMQGRITGIPVIGSHSGTGSTWEGEKTGVEVAEYHCADGRVLCVPELKLPLAFAPNPIYPEPGFVVMRRYSFNRNVSAYHHVIGLVAMMAKLNILGLIASEDSVFRETNVVGEIESGHYRFGRGVINKFSPGTTIERPTGDQAQSLWAQIDRLERQLRIGAAYDVSSDGISPNSFATQAGIQELQSGTERNVAEYQKVIRLGTERLDTRRLMWAERVWPRRKTRIYNYTTADTKTYRPDRDIKGDYRTRRRHAIGGLWGSTTNVVTALQLLQTGVLDIESIQDSVPGITDGEAILARNRARKAEEMLLGRLSQMPPGQPIMMGDVEAAFIEIMRDPDDQDEILIKYLTAPEQPEPQPGMMGPPGGPPPDVWSMMEQMGGGGPPAIPPEAAQTTMSRIMSNNTADAGVQLAGQL